MFEKLKQKVTGVAVEHTKETLNDKLETYSGIIKIGLTLGVIIFGSKKINDHHIRKQEMQQPALPYPDQRPIVINNYIQERSAYPYGGQRKSYQKN